MEDDHSDSQEKLWFPRRLRELRVAASKKQREVAAFLGLAESSYANAESANHKRISLDRVRRLAGMYQLDKAATEELVAGWHALPDSEYNQRQAKSYEKRKEFRSKARNFDRMKLGLLEMTTMLVTNVPDPAQLCTCGEVDMFAEDSSGQQCELCDALRLLGLTGWTNLDDVIAKLAAAQEGMTG